MCGTVAVIDIKVALKTYHEKKKKINTLQCCLTLHLQFINDFIDL